MLKFSRTLICVLLVVSILGPITAGRGSSFGRSSHSYPSSRGSSGSRSGGHSYPSSGGLSGGGHSYPSSGGLSGGGHSYPSSGGRSGGSHSYPTGGQSGGGHSYPKGGLSGGSGSHSYPSGSGLSGSGSKPQTHGYPSGSSYNKYPSSTNTHTSHTTVHHHYNYSPPQQIRYVGASGPSTFPVYHGQAPTYVYNYKNSGSKYGTLLAGLALFNLGALAGGVYASSHNSHSSSAYKSQPGEVCKFGLRKENGDYEETKIDCQIITYFIFQDQSSTRNNPTSGNTTVTSTTVTNTTTVNTMNPGVGTQVMLPNGTLVMSNATVPGANNTTVTVTTTTTNTTTNALDVKGAPIKVNPNMKCYVIRNTPTSNLRKSIDCGLLQTYADQSLRKNSAVRNIPTFTILTAIIAAFVMY